MAQQGAATRGEWSATVEEIHEMEMFAFSVRLKRCKVQRYWSKWLLYLNENTR